MRSGINKSKCSDEDTVYHSSTIKIEANLRNKTWPQLKMTVYMIMEAQQPVRGLWLNIGLFAQSLHTLYIVLKGSLISDFCGTAVRKPPSFSISHSLSIAPTIIFL